MKKLIGFLLLVFVFLGLAYTYFKGQKPVEGGISTSDLKIRSIAKDNETDYAVKFSIHFQKSGEALREIVSLDGVLTKYAFNETDSVSEWKAIDQYSVDAKPMDPASIQTIVGKQTLSGPEGHSLADGLPQAFLRTHLMIMDRFVVKVPVASLAILKQDEQDDLVPFTAEYSFGKDRDLTVIRKKWLSYQNPTSTVDPDFNTLTYYFDRNQQLLAVDGKIKSSFKEQGTSELIIAFSAKAIETRPALARLRSLDKGSFKLVDSARVKNSDIQARAQLSMGFDEALKELETVTETTDGKKYYELFRALTDQLRAKPELSAELSKTILETKGREPDSRRRLSAMFGALAESQNQEGIDTLTSLANACPDNYCKVQAIMGVNTHAKPSPANTEAMLEIARSSGDKEVVATALIAAGATGRKLDEEIPDLSKELIRTFNDPGKADLKTSTIAAMGNHGSPEYWPSLAAGLKSEDSTIRSASVYSLRYIPNEDVNKAIINVIDKEEISAVVSEALKASGYRKLSGDDYNHIANRAANFNNKELVSQTASLLIEVYRDHPESTQNALNQLRDKTKYQDVKVFIDSQLKKVEGEAKP